MILPQADLDDLAETLDAGHIQPLRDRFDHPRRVRQELVRFTDRVFLFPFGINADRTNIIEVYRNGLMQWNDHEVFFVQVGTIRPITVVVLDHPAHRLDLLQASYIAILSPLS